MIDPLPLISCLLRPPVFIHRIPVFISLILSALLMDAKAVEDPMLIIDTKGISGDTVRSVDISNDGRWLAASSGKAVRVYDLRRGELAGTLRGYRRPGEGHVGRINVIRFTPDSSYLIVAISDQNEEYGSTRVYRISDLENIHQMIPAHLGCTRKLAIAPDGSLAATTGCDGRYFFLQPQGEEGKWTPKFTLAAGEVPTMVPRDKGSVNTSYFGFPTGDAQWFLQMESEFDVMVSTGSFSWFTDWDDSPRSMRAVSAAIANLSLPFTEGGADVAATGMDIAQDRIAVCGQSVQGRDATYWSAVFDLKTRRLLFAYPKHADRPSAIKVNTSAGLVACGDQFGAVHVWRIDTGEAALPALRPKAKKLYRVAWADNNRDLLYAEDFFRDSTYNYNRNGAISHQFVMSERSIRSASNPEDDPVNPEDIGGDGRTRKLIASRSNADPSGFTLRLSVDRGSPVDLLTPERQALVKPPRRTDLVHLGAPWCFKWVPKSLRVSGDPEFILGTDAGTLEQYSIRAARDGRPVAVLQKRFVGHSAKITSFDFNVAAGYLASCGYDGTIRLWNLKLNDSVGDIDFYADGTTILDVPAGSNAARAGIRDADRIASINGRSFFERHRENPRPGQTVELELQRDDQSGDAESFSTETLTVRVQLVAAPPVIEPFQTIFLTNDDDWITWTPQGHFDASPGGEAYVGWHVNRERHQPALFHSVGQFRKLLYRPDLVDAAFDPDKKTQTTLGSAAATAFAPSRPKQDLRLGADFKAVTPPEVHITSPADGRRTQDDSIALRVTSLITGGRFGKIDLRINGEPLLAPITENASTLREGSLVTYDVAVPLPKAGRYTLSASVATRESTSRVQRVTVTRTESKTPSSRTRQRPQPQLFVLAIGVSDYVNEDLRLKCAGTDAESFVQRMRDQEGQLYSKVTAKLVVNAQANVNGIREGMQWLSEKSLAEDDQVFIFYSGHGVFDRFNTWYLSGVDLDENKLSQTAISHAEFSSWLDEKIASPRVLFADTCHAGAFHQLRKHHSQGIDPLRGISTMALVSCKSKQESFERSSDTNSVFTSVLLQGLSCQRCDINSDHRIDFNELVSYVKQGVMKETNERQTPVAMDSLQVSQLMISALP